MNRNWRKPAKKLFPRVAVSVEKVVVTSPKIDPVAVAVSTLFENVADGESGTFFSGYYIYATIKRICGREVRIPMCQTFPDR